MTSTYSDPPAFVNRNFCSICDSKFSNRWRAKASTSPTRTAATARGTLRHGHSCTCDDFLGKISFLMLHALCLCSETFDYFVGIERAVHVQGRFRLEVYAIHDRSRDVFMFGVSHMNCCMSHVSDLPRVFTTYVYSLRSCIRTTVFAFVIPSAASVLCSNETRTCFNRMILQANKAACTLSYIFFQDACLAP